MLVPLAHVYSRFMVDLTKNEIAHETTLIHDYKFEGPKSRKLGILGLYTIYTFQTLSLTYSR